MIADNNYFTGFNFLWGVKLGRFWVEKFF
jgi:hypothetical protein